ncbi:MAG: aldose 1-epimerase family protein, partial [Acutalibacteraceae bacterium]
MVTLKNDKMTAEIAEKGAELKSVYYNDFEYIWCADPSVWGSSSPVLFPICGALKNDRYDYNGKTYNMCKHGFVRKEIFEVESYSKSNAVFLYKSNKKTREMYPFD